MNIAVHIDADVLSSSFLWSHIQWMSQQQPQHKWIIFHNNKIKLPSLSLPQCSFVPVKPSLKNSLLLHYWYQFKLPIWLKKVKADLFISELQVVSTRTQVPQIMVISNSFFIADKKSSASLFLRYQQKNMQKFIQQSKSMIAVNEWVAGKINLEYPSSKNKTSIVAPVLHPSFAPMLWEQRDSVLNLYSNDIEYFYSYHNADTQPYMMLLLKAFSLFKKRMKSGLQLVLLQTTTEEPVKDFHLYKYRKDVHLHKVGDVAIEAAIVGASFAGIFLQGDVLSDWGAMHCIKAGNVPIVPNAQRNQQIFGEAALYVEEGQQALADAMMLVYKDEAAKKQRLQAGESWIKNYQQQNNPLLFEQTISTVTTQ